MRVCWDGRGKEETSLAQLVVPVIRARSGKDWLMSEGHRKSLEGAPTGTYWDNFVFFSFIEVLLIYNLSKLKVYRVMM